MLNVSERSVVVGREELHFDDFVPEDKTEESVSEFMEHNPRSGEIDISVAESCSQLFSENVCDDLHDKRRREQWQQSSPENEKGGL